MPFYFFFFFFLSLLLLFCIVLLSLHAFHGTAFFFILIAFFCLWRVSKNMFCCCCFAVVFFLRSLLLLLLLRRLSSSYIFLSSWFPHSLSHFSRDSTHTGFHSFFYPFHNLKNFTTHFFQIKWNQFPLFAEKSNAFLLGVCVVCVFMFALAERNHDDERTRRIVFLLRSVLTNKWLRVPEIMGEKKEIEL